MTKFHDYTHIDICKNALFNISIYNNFKRIPEYTKILEHTTEYFGIEYIKLIFSEHEKYAKLLDWKKLKENDLIGNPNLSNFIILKDYLNIDDCIFSPSTIYYIYRGLDIIDKILVNDNINILEIGGGYGGQCKLIIDMCSMLGININKYGIIDLESASKLQDKYLSTFEYKNVEFFEYENIKNFDDFKLYNNLISVYALSEFEVDVQDYYINNIIKYMDNIYILCNVQIDNTYFSDCKLIEGLPEVGRYHKLIYKTKKMRSLILHTYGDSHASHYGGWNKINIDGLHIKINHIAGKLMYSFGRDMMDVVNNINNGDMVCFCFGEIDCRCHIHKYEANWKKVIDDIVEKYFINIKNNVERYKNLKVFVYNVVPPLERELPKNLWIEKGNGLPSLGSDEDRKKYTLYMNEKIKEYCITYNYIFFDIYNKYVNKRGYLEATLSDNNCHIYNPIYMREFLLNKINQ
jgi:hypothetical protein